MTKGHLWQISDGYHFLQLATLKQRAEKAARTATGSQAHQLVPLSDANFVGQLEMMVATLKIPLERRNKRSGRTEKACAAPWACLRRLLYFSH